MVKVLLVHNHYQIPGGEDTVVENEKKMLEEHGDQVILYTRNNSEVHSFSRGQKLLVPFQFLSNDRTYREIKELIQREKPDLVHVHNTLFLISPSVYQAAKDCGIPVIQTIHNFRLICPGAMLYRDGHICEDCIEHGLHCALKHKCYRGSFAQTLLCVLSDRRERRRRTYSDLYYICLSTFNKEKLLSLKQISSDHVFVKPNSAEAHAVLPYDKRRNAFVYAGRLEERKGIDFLLRTWARLEQSVEEAPDLLVIGSGPLEEWCHSYGKNMKHVQFLGRLENKDTVQKVSECKALILPTQWYEGFPMSMVEAFSTGTPVLCSDIGNAASMIVEGINGHTFPINNEEALVRQILGFSDMVGSTHREFLKRYSNESNYEVLMKIYEEVLKHE